MALRRSRLTLIFINVILLFALCAKPISSQGKEDVPPPPLPKLDLLKSSGSQNGDPLWYIQHLEQLKWYIEDYAAWFPSRQACPAVSSQPGKHCYSQCQENYAAASELVTSSLESLNKPDIPKAKCDLGNVATNIQKCQDCFEQTEKDQAMTDINVFLIKQTQDFIEILKTVKGVQKLSVDQNDKEDVPPPPFPKLDLQKSLGGGDPVQCAIQHLEQMKPALDNYKKYFPERKACWKSAQSAKHCYDQCQENYGVATDFVNACIESLRQQDFPKAKCDIGNFNTNIQKCQDCFEQSEKDQVITDINGWCQGSIQWCIDVVPQLQGEQKLSVGQNYNPPPSLPKLAAQKSLGDPKQDVCNHAIGLLEQMSQYYIGYKGWFESQKRCPYVPEEEKKCCTQCEGNMDRAVENGKAAIESINKQDLPKAIGDVNGMAREVQICIDCYEVAKKGAIESLIDYVTNWTANCLNTLNYANGEQKLSIDQNDAATKKAIEQLEGIKHDL